jgi:hypothetical protein
VVITLRGLSLRLREPKRKCEKNLDESSDLENVRIFLMQISSDRNPMLVYINGFDTI